MAGGALHAAESVAAADTPAASGRTELLSQKLKLLEIYLRSQRAAAIRASDDAKAKTLITQAEALLDQARSAEARGDIAGAEEALELGLRDVSEASRRLAVGKAGTGPSDAKRRHAEIKRRTESYLRAIKRALPDLQPGSDLHDTLRRVESLVSEGDRVASGGRYPEAYQLLRSAYELTIGAVSALHQGKVAVARLEFKSPLEELDYERRRHQSYEMLVQLLTTEARHRDGSFQATAERAIDESRALRSRADSLAKVGEHAAAITVMERATARLAQTLRLGGLPVSE